MVDCDHGEEKEEDEEHQMETILRHGEEEEVEHEMMACLYHGEVEVVEQVDHVMNMLLHH